MGLFDSLLNPSEPAPLNLPSLPTPNINLGNVLSGAENLASQALFNRSPQQVGQGVQQLSSDVGSGLSSIKGDFSSLGNLLKPISQGMEQGFLGQEPTGISGGMGAGIGGFNVLAGMGGEELNKGLQGLEQATAPPPGMKYSDYLPPGVVPFATAAHAATIVGQGPGDLAQNLPDIENKLADSFRQGFKGTFAPGISWSNADTESAVQKLLDAGNEVGNSLIDPRLINYAIYSGMKNNGASEDDATNTAYTLAEPIAAVAQLAIPGGKAGEGGRIAGAISKFAGGPMQRALMAQFVAGLSADPKATLGAFKQNGGDFLNLLGTTANMIRGGQHPDAQTIENGLMGLAQTVPAIFLLLHGGSKAAGLASHLSYKAADHLARTPEDDPAGSKEIRQIIESKAAEAEARQTVPNTASANEKLPDLVNKPELSNLRNALRSVYGTEDIQQATQARAASEAGQVSQASEAGQGGPTQIPGRPGEGGQGAGLATAERPTEGIQGEGIPERNAQPNAAPINYEGEHAEGVPQEARNAVEDTLNKSGINNDGWVNKIRLDDSPAGRKMMGYWNPEDPRTINLDLDTLGKQEIGTRLEDLKDRLTQAAAKYGDKPKRQAALSQANQALTNTAKNMSPQFVMNWIAAHESLHATLGKIYDYPPDSIPVKRGTPASRYSFEGEALQMIRHLDSTVEGKAWLDHLQQNMGLEGEVEQLRTLADAFRGKTLDDLYDQIPVWPDKIRRSVTDASSRVNEALVHAILNAKDLSPYPYHFTSGDRAYEKSFWNPEARKENDRLAAAYYDTHRSRSVSDVSPTAAGGIGDATLPGTARTASPTDRTRGSASSDQTRLTQLINDPEKLLNLSKVFKGSLSDFVTGLTADPKTPEAKKSATALSKLGKDKSYWNSIAKQLQKTTPEEQKPIPLGPARQAVIDSWHKGLSDTEQQITDIQSKARPNQDLVRKLQANADVLRSQIQHLSTKDIDPGTAARLAQEEVRQKYPDLFEPVRPEDMQRAAPKPEEFQETPAEASQPQEPTPVSQEAAPQSQGPQKITPESAKAAITQLEQERATRTPRESAAGPFNELEPEAQKAIMDEGMKVLTDLGNQIDAARAAGDKSKALDLEVQRYGVATYINKMLGPEPEAPPPAPKEMDYQGEALRLTNVRPDNYMSPLKGLATDVTSALERYNKALATGASPDALLPYQKDLQWNMAKFRAAHDLYSSKEFRDGIDKQSYNWKGTRDIARRIAADDRMSPRDKALTAVRLLGEQTKKPYTLNDAAKAIKDTALGVSKEAKNWHPQFKKLLAGEMWHAAQEAQAENPQLPLGIDNIPLQDMIRYEDLEGLNDQLVTKQRETDAQFKKYQAELHQTQIMERHGQVPKGTALKMIREQRKLNLDNSNEQARLQALIDNHPDSMQARQANAPPPTAEQLNVKPSVEAVRTKYGNNPYENMPNSFLINEAKAWNEKIATPSPDLFSRESFLDDGVTGVSKGEPPPNNGQPWFTPKWGEALTNLRELGGPYALLADHTQDLMVQMAKHLDPSRNMWHPKEWFRAHWEAIAGIPQRVSHIQDALKQIMDASKDPNFSRAVLDAIDDTNDVAQKVAAGNLTKEQAAVANFLNEYWRGTREQFRDPKLGTDPVVGHFIENYVPHIVLKDPDGNVLYNPKKAAWSSKSFAAKKRIFDDAAGQPLYRTLQTLEKEGYTVQRDLDQVFGAHANSTFKMIKLKEMKNSLGGLIYHSPDGKFVGFPIVHIDDLPRMQRENAALVQRGEQPLYKGLDAFDGNKAMVRFGPGQNLFQSFRVHPELAREIEKLANIRDLPGSQISNFFRSLGGIFKFIEFSINPRHAFNVFSNVANLYGPAGVIDPRIWRNVYGRANRALLPSQQGGFFRNVSSRGEQARVTKLLNEKAGLERQMHDIHNRMQLIGDDPLDFQPWSLSTEAASLRDEFNSRREDLIAKHQELDQALGARDRRMLGELMDRGLVPDRDLIEGADLNGLSQWSEKIPGLGHFHRWMWRDVVWRGQIGTAMHLSDQFTMKAAKDYGWDGKGGAARAETFLTPEMRDGIQRKAVWQAKQATALMNKIDMSQGWQLLGRATLLSAPWTMGQLQATRDMLGNNPVSRLLGREDYTQVSDKMLQSGFGKKEAQFLDNMHTKLARRMMFAGTAKLAMTAMMQQALGTWLTTGQIGNPISNFFRDPSHTFDIYTGKDPATGIDNWIDNPLFGFQHEMINYALAGVKAGMEGKPWWQVGMAPLSRFANKNNPTLRNVIDLGLGIETSRWLAGLQPGMGDDPDLQNLHRAADSLGIPDFGSAEDRFLYFLRSFPKPPLMSVGGFATTAVKRGPDLKPILDANGQEIPLTDPRSLLSDVGLGGIADLALGAATNGWATSPGDFAARGGLQQAGASLLDPKVLAGFAGTTMVNSSRPLYDASLGQGGLNIQQDPQGYFPEQAKIAQAQANEQRYIQSQQALVQIGNLAASGNPDDFAKIAQIRDQQGLTDNQVVQAIMHGASVNINNKTLRSTGLGAVAAKSGSNVTVNGQELTPNQAAQYEKMRSTRELYVIQQLKNDSMFINAPASTKAVMINQAVAVADKFNTAQAAQTFLGTGGKAMTDGDFVNIVNDSLNARSMISAELMQSDVYRTADAATQLKMQQSYMSMADTIAWDRRFGNLKTLTDSQYRNLVGNTVVTEGQVLDYLHTVPFFAQADTNTQSSMMKEYSGLVRQMNLNVYNGKTNSLSPLEIGGYMRAVVNTEETAKYLLHQSDFYNNSDLKTQQSLDTKYANLSRSLALTDWKNGKAMLDLGQAGQAYEVGPEKLIVGHLLAAQGYSDLENQFGGSALLTSYAQQETAIKDEIKQNVDAPPSTLTRLQNIAVAAFERANPQYSDFKKARTNWEKGTTIGKLYLALNAGETALAGSDTSVIADPTTVGETLDMAVDGSTLIPDDTNTSDPTDTTG